MKEDIYRETMKRLHKYWYEQPYVLFRKDYNPNSYKAKYQVENAEKLFNQWFTYNWDKHAFKGVKNIYELSIKLNLLGY